MENQTAPQPASPTATAATPVAPAPAEPQPKEELPRWNLSDLYSGPDDPRIETDLKSAEDLADQLALYKGRLHEPVQLILALGFYEEISRLIRCVGTYAGLMCQIDLRNEVLSALEKRVEVRVRAIGNQIRFLALEIGAMPATTFQGLMDKNPGLKQFTHCLQKTRAAHVHRLSEGEENLSADKDLSGKNVLESLFDIEFSGSDFQLQLPKPRMVTENEIRGLLRHPDRIMRQDAAAGLTKGLEEKKKRLGLIFQGILRDCATEDQHRGYQAPEDRRNMSNELRDATVDAMVKAVIANYGIVARYFQMKQQLLGFIDFYEWDRYAPLALRVEAPIYFKDTQRIVTEVFEQFDPDFGKIVRQAWNWLDAEPRPGKRSGGFCASIAPGVHPWVLVNFLGKVDDITTIAHEFGHAVHAVLSGEAAKNINDYQPPVAIAEIASIFMESLTFDTLLASLSTKDRLAMLLQRIDGTLATVFRQATMHRFEAETHRLLRAQGSITTDEIGEIWQRLQREMHGRSVHFTDNHKLWWMYITHFFQYPFYVYSYSFGQLLAIALYRRYKEEGSAFVGQYKEILAAGGSKSPYNLFTPLGINLDDPSFWQGGLDYISGLVTEAESLAKELGLLKTE